ncbi:phosphotransferase [Paenibacillaceae bacterium WGS1546]|uniref:phosphotransferase family protein n=1 Tax=Cohnella sp. WGS1546 TaxID=3366810 RepID=UPI00372D6BA1
MNLGEPIAIGNTAKIYLHDGKIIKVFNDHLPDTEAEYETNKQKLAHAYGLPVPHIYEVTKVNGKQAIVMEHIKGDTIGSLLFADRSKAKQYTDLSVDIQLKIHAVKAPGLEWMSDKLSRQITSAHQLDDKQKNALLERLDAIKYDPYLCHGDYHVFNLILNENQVVIIDWVDASSGDVRADVCRTYLLYAQFSADLADLYLRLYCDKSGIRQDEIFLWAPVIAGARLSEHVSSEKASRLIEIVNKYCPKMV